MSTPAPVVPMAARYRLKVYIAAPLEMKKALMDRVLPLFREHLQLEVMSSWLTEPMRDPERAPDKASQQRIKDLIRADVLVVDLVPSSATDMATLWEMGFFYRVLETAHDLGDVEFPAQSYLFAVNGGGDLRQSPFCCFTIPPVNRRNSWTQMIQLLLEVNSRQMS